MGLTRIKAAQISNIDYKQSVRVISLADVTLAGGAPNQVDGVNLLAGDRVLVAGQSDATQNGIYRVSILGTGTDGTWVRTSDANEDGEIQPGMVVMVTQGTTYADTPWKLVTNGEIVIGTTELTFEENYSLAFGNISANGTAVIASEVSAALTLEAGENISITGNNTSKTVTIGVTGISFDSISNGTSNVTVVSSGGNVTVGVGGTNDTAVFSTAGVDVTGRVSASGNVTGGNISTAGVITVTGNVTAGNLSGTNITGTLTTAAQPNITSVGTLTSVTVTGNVAGGNLTTSGAVTGNGSALTSLSASNISSGTLDMARLGTTGNLQLGSLGVGTAASNTVGEIRATNNITAFYSDRRLKTDIRPLDHALERVRAISGVTFRSSAVAAQYGYLDSSTQVGVIAQEVAEVLPEVVVPAPFDIGQRDDGTEFSLSGQDYKTVRYEKLVPLLIEAIKDLDKLVKNLAQDIDHLRKNADP